MMRRILLSPVKLLKSSTQNNRAHSNAGRIPGMELKRIDYNFTVCKITDVSTVNVDTDFYFIAKTDEELSLVCKTEETPQDTVERDDGWRGFRIQGVLDFSLIGILSKLSGILAEHKIGIFAVSTYNTDYIFVKKENFERALNILASEGYTVV